MQSRFSARTACTRSFWAARMSSTRCLALLVGEHLGDEVRAADRPVGRRRRTRSASRPCRTSPPCSPPGSSRAPGRPPGPCRIRPGTCSSATSPPSAIAIPASISDRVRVKRSSSSLCASSPSEPRRLMIESTSRRRLFPSEVGDGRVARLVRRDRLAVGVGVDDGLLQPDLLGELRLHHVVEVHLPATRRAARRAAPRRTGARSSRGCSRTSRARCARGPSDRRAARGASCDPGRSRSGRCARPWSARRSTDGDRTGRGAGAPGPASRRGSSRRSAGCCCSWASSTRTWRSVGRYPFTQPRNFVRIRVRNGG